MGIKLIKYCMLAVNCGRDLSGLNDYKNVID